MLSAQCVAGCGKLGSLLPSLPCFSASASSPGTWTAGSCMNDPAVQLQMLSDKFLKGEICWYSMRSPTASGKSLEPSAACRQKYGAELDETIATLDKYVDDRWNEEWPRFQKQVAETKYIVPKPPAVTPPPEPEPPKPWYKTWKVLIPVGGAAALLGGVVWYRRR